MSGINLRTWGPIMLSVSVALSVAAMTATGAIKARQHEMEGIRDEMKVLGAIAKKEQPFDAGVVQASAAKIADHLATAADLFPEGSDAGDVETLAKPEIWTDRATFDTTLESTRQAAVAMQAVSSADAFPPALGKLGNGCKTCHDLFREPKK